MSKANTTNSGTVPTQTAYTLKRAGESRTFWVHFSCASCNSQRQTNTTALADDPAVQWAEAAKFADDLVTKHSNGWDHVQAASSALARGHSKAWPSKIRQTGPAMFVATIHCDLCHSDANVEIPETDLARVKAIALNAAASHLTQDHTPEEPKETVPASREESWRRKQEDTLRAKLRRMDFDTLREFAMDTVRIAHGENLNEDEEIKGADTVEALCALVNNYGLKPGGNLDDYEPDPRAEAREQKINQAVRHENAAAVLLSQGMDDMAADHEKEAKRLRDAVHDDRFDEANEDATGQDLDAFVGDT